MEDKELRRSDCKPGRHITDHKRRASMVLVAALTLALSALGADPELSPERNSTPTSLDAAAAEVGLASYYGSKHHGRKTASGEIFDMHALTAAHRTLPFGTRLKVTRPDNRRSVTVRINDRGPFVKGRVIDLSLAAAAELQMVKSGIAQVRLDIVE